MHPKTRLLLAAAALALIPGPAAAQGIALSGDARMGLEYDDRRDADDPNVSKWQMTSRARLAFTVDFETETGLFLGAGFRADEAVEAAGNTVMTGGYVYIASLDFGALVMGDASGAARHRVGDLDFTSLTGLGDWNEMIYLDRLQEGDTALFVADFERPDRRTAARYEFTRDAFSLSVSLDQFRKVEDIDLPDVVGTGIDLLGTARGRGWSVAGSYDFGNGRLSLGYEDLRITSDADSFRATHAIIGAEARFDAVTVKAIYGRAGADLGDFLELFDFSRDQYGASVEARVDAVTVSLFGNRDFFRNRKAGLGASYDLGGGAEIVGAVARERPLAGANRTRADFGVAMTF